MISKLSNIISPSCTIISGCWYCKNFGQKVKNCTIFSPFSSLIPYFISWFANFLAFSSNSSKLLSFFSHFEKYLFSLYALHVHFVCLFYFYEKITKWTSLGLPPLKKLKNHKQLFRADSQWLKRIVLKATS